MNEYDFTLTFALPGAGEDPDEYVDALYEAGCDDATIGVGAHGAISLIFTREAPSALEAVSSAIGNVQEAIPGARLVEAAPDFVGLTDMATLFECTRQNMRKLVVNPYGPPPIYGGKTAVWHLANVISWLSEKRYRHHDDKLFELAKINKALNLAVDRESVDPELEERARSLCA